MDEHLYAVGRNAEEPACLHHLEAFVHECCRVDGNFCAHVPSGVFQGIGSGDRLQLLLRELAERSTRASKQDFFYFVVAFAYQTLEDGRVLTVDGQDGHMVLLSQLADELTSHDECLLVGQTYLLPCTDGMDGWLQTRKAHHGCEHHVDGAGLHDVAESLCSGINLDVGAVAEQRLQFVVALLVGNDHRGWVVLPGLLGQ